MSREDADRAVTNLEIHELPSARGCTYVLPAADFPLALKLAQDSDEASMKVARKLGVTDKEIDTLCDAVVKALAKGPLDPDEIRKAVGDAARSLGPEGVKKGMSTTLPTALGQLQTAGEIRRIPTNGRFDQQRYRYTSWKPNPLKGFKLSKEDAYTELAHRYFSWIGPATVAQFQWFSGLSGKVAKAAVEPLKLADTGEGRLLLPEHRDEFESFRVPKEPHYVLVSSLDGIALLRRDLKSVVESGDAQRKVFVEKDSKELGSLADLPSHGIFDRGRLVGLWEYDTETQSIAWASFIGKDRALKDAVARTEQYIAEQLGDARSFSLDSPKSRSPRIQALRAAAGA